MITEDYVSFETAKTLKEKGFDELCQNLYRKTHEILSCSTVNLPELTNSQLDNLKNLQAWIDKMFVYTCPTLQMAVKWLREVHNLFILISVDNMVSGYEWSIYYTDSHEITPYAESGYKSYEDACEAAIRYCLENLI